MGIARMETIKAVFVGDALAGKTSLILRNITRENPNIEYWDVTPLPQNYDTKVLVDGRNVKLSLWDIPGLMDLDNWFLTKFVYTYTNTDVIVIVFSIDNEISYSNVKYTHQEI